MKKHYFYSVLATAALAFTACSSLPKLPADLQAGVDANNPEAFYKAGQYYDNLKNASKSSKWAKSAELYRKGADLGDAGCQHELGYAYQQGAGVPRDYGQARAWYMRAAEQNRAGALCDLGWLYENGLGVPVNYAVAKDYYERSRALGSAVAVNNLGAMYSKGHGVKVDKSKALKLYEQAASMGISTAKDNATALRNEMNFQSPSNIDNMVYKERGEVVYITGSRSAWDTYHSDDGTYFGPSSGVYDLAYKKTGEKTAQIGWARGHREANTYLRFTTRTSGYVYRYEYITRDGESVSNKRVPFTLERR